MVLGTIGMYHTIIQIDNVDIKIGDIVQMPAKTIFINPNIRREYR